jgi:serine carboxypeptidase 1
MKLLALFHKLISLHGFLQNIENFMLDTGSNPLSEDSSTSQAFGSASNTIDDIMNGVIKQKLKIIPKDIM